MEINKSEALTKDDILETIRTLNAINSAIMVGAHVAIEKFMAHKNVSSKHRKFFINEIAKSLVSNPEIRNQVIKIQRGGLFGRSKQITNPVNQMPLQNQSPNSSATDNLSIESGEVGVNGDGSNESFQSNMEDTFIESMMENYGTVTKGIFKKIVQVSSNIFGKLINFATGGILYKPPEELTSETNKIILVLSMVLKDLSTDENQIQAMKDISEAFTKTMLDVMDVILPSVKMMVSKTFDNISTIGAQSASGGMKVFISTAKAAISEVPIVGGIINLILAFGEAFNVFSKILSTLTTSGSNMSKDFVDAYIKARNKFEESFAKHNLKVKQLKALRDSSPPIAAITQLQPVPTLQTQTNNQTSGILPEIVPQSQPQQKKGVFSRLPVPWRKTQKNLSGGKRIINGNKNKKYKTIKIRRKKQMVNKINKNKKRKTVKWSNKYKKQNHKTKK